MELATYRDMQRAVKEINDFLGVAQRFINTPKEELIRFLTNTYSKYGENLPEFALQVCQSLPEPGYENMGCPAFGKGYDPTVEECVECMRESPVEASKCRYLTVKKEVKRQKDFIQAPEILEPDCSGAYSMNVMFDIMCNRPTMTWRELEAKTKEAGIAYNYRSLKLVYRRVRKVVALLRKHGHME
jgi:hypothetical protein